MDRSGDDLLNRRLKGLAVALSLSAIAIGVFVSYSTLTPTVGSRFDPNRLPWRDVQQIKSIDFRLVQSTPAAWAKIYTIALNVSDGVAEGNYQEALVTGPEKIEVTFERSLRLDAADVERIYGALREGLSQTRTSAKVTSASLEIFLKVTYTDDSVMTVYGQGGLLLLSLATGSDPRHEADPIRLEPQKALDAFLELMTNLRTKE